MRRKARGDIKILPGGNQMSLIRDTEEVVKFLEFAGRKSILNDTAVGCRLTACNNLFSVLNEDEDNLNYILKNLDVLIHRLSNKNLNVNAATLKVYKSRVKSSIEDFKAWSSDPFAWERAVSDKAKATAVDGRKNPKTSRKRMKSAVTIKAKGKAAVEPIQAPSRKGQSSTEMHKVSFPIRSGTSVEVSLPAEGITLKELQRLGMFLYPYCTDIEPGRIAWPGPDEK